MAYTEPQQSSLSSSGCCSALPLPQPGTCNTQMESPAVQALQQRLLQRAAAAASHDHPAVAAVTSGAAPIPRQDRARR